MYRRVLALLLVAAVSSCQAATPEELITMANQAGAPFDLWYERFVLKGKDWGAKRGNRSSDIVIINASWISFQISNDSPQCSFGTPTQTLLPNFQLNEFNSIAFGIENSQVQQGVSCTFYYEDPSTYSCYLRINVTNPWDGDKVVHVTSSFGLDVNVEYDKDDHNQVRIKVMTAGIPPPTMLGAVAPSCTFYHEEGARSNFFNASKRGLNSRLMRT